MRIVRYPFSLVRCEKASDPSAPVVERLRAKPSAVMPECREEGRGDFTSSIPEPPHLLYEQGVTYPSNE